MRLEELQKYWKIIRQEVRALPAHTHDLWVDSDDPGFFKWPLLYEGSVIQERAVWCPKTTELIRRVDEDIHIAGFSLFTAGHGLPPHTDTDENCENYAFTYHLGIDCPRDCYLNHSKDGIIYECNGKEIRMDNTYPHFAVNESDKDRIILYMEIKKPNLLTRVKRLFA